MTEADADARRDAAAWLHLPDGEAFGADRLEELGAAHAYQLVVLVGPKNVGKTTLLAELHHRFLSGPFAGYLFAGSRTLPAFERRCYLARTTSRNRKADTARSRIASGAQYLHLALRDEGLKQPSKHLLVCDDSGERFKTMHMNPEDAKSLAPLLSAAHRAVFMLDGRRLSLDRTRQSVRAESRTLLRSLIETRSLSRESNVNLVVSKWDYIVERDAESFAETVLAEAVTSFSDSVGRLEVFRLSARPSERSGLLAGYGLDSLLQSWAADPPALEDGDLPPKEQATRSFLRFA